MKIVIEISDRLIKKVKDHYVNPYEVDEICEAILDGTPLPEHHGRLIDADAFQKYCFDKTFDKRLSEAGLAIINIFLELQPTIIEGSESE